ncbi:MAG: glycoside hydrolase family 3 N-terminal domain-containing protein [Elainellaceae cyanobacterium]
MIDRQSAALPDWRWSKTGPQGPSLPLRQQVAQLVVARASGHLFDHQIAYPAWEPPQDVLHHWVNDLGIGGVILLGGSAAEVAQRCAQLQGWASVPLLLTADIEEGVGQRFAGATWFPPPMAIGAIAHSTLQQAKDYARTMGSVTAREALALGLNWVLAPVVDVNNNSDNPVINVRAFGDDPATVEALTVAFVEGAHTHPVLTAAKHFPGHGDTAIDSHLELPTIHHDRDRLEAIELPPFEAAIAAGVDSVMSAHLLVPALDPQRPATLSPKILTGVLRQDLGFDGLIVTDALVMGAIAQKYGTGEASVMAIEAGADVLMMPLDPVEAVEAVCVAVESGRIAPERIHQSLERIWRSKARVCVKPAGSLADSSTPKNLWEQLSQPAAAVTVDQILEQSLERQGGPAPSVQGGHNVIVIDDCLACDFLDRQAPTVTRPAQQGYTTLHLVDARCPLPQIPADAPVLLQLFVRGNPFRGSAKLLDQRWQGLVSQSRLQAVVVYGSPYSWRRVRDSLPATLPGVFTYGQMPAAQAIALKVLFATPKFSQPQ